jgi:hypothetical protein
MISVYGGYVLTFTITSQHANAAFTTPAAGAGLISGRSGAGQGLTWDVGTQALATSVTITCTVTVGSAFENPAALGGVGVFNVQGLPVGTYLTVAGVGQRLTPGERGELNAIALPQITGNSFNIVIFNDVNANLTAAQAAGGSAASIASGASFYIGQVYAGRAVQLPTLLDGSPMTDDIFDPTAFSRAGGLQLYQTMRKNVRQYSQSIGRFTTADARGGTAGTLYNGNLSTGKMDIAYLRSYLATSPLCMVCDVPSAGFASATPTGQLRFNQQFMQNNFMLARMTQMGAIVLDQPPYWVWEGAQFQEAT